jgi:hypothetical protein
MRDAASLRLSAMVRAGWSGTKQGASKGETNGDRLSRLQSPPARLPNPATEPAPRRFNVSTGSRWSSWTHGGNLLLGVAACDGGAACDSASNRGGYDKTAGALPNALIGLTCRSTSDTFGQCLRNRFLRG